MYTYIMNKSISKDIDLVYLRTYRAVHEMEIVICKMNHLSISKN